MRLKGINHYRKVDADFDIVSWDEAMDRMEWNPGEHVTLIGPTGTGKTEVITRLLEDRRNWIFLGTKRRDSTQDALEKMGGQFIADARELEPEISTRYIVKPGWPNAKADASAIKEHHRRVFLGILTRARAQGEWTVVADELRYITGFLGLSEEMLLLWLQGRSDGISVVGATQRPRFVPLEAYDQPEHLFFFRDSDIGNIRRVAELVSVHRFAVEEIVPNLYGHDVLYVNTRTGDLFVTNTRR